MSIAAAVKQAQSKYRQIGREDYRRGVPRDQNPFRFCGGANKYAKAAGWDDGWMAEKKIDTGNVT